MTKKLEIVIFLVTWVFTDLIFVFGSSLVATP